MMGRIKERNLALYMILLVILMACSKTDSQTMQVNKGNFTQTITETGELAAVTVRAFTMQRYGRNWYNMKIIGLLDHGTMVKAGDSIIQFDPSQVQRFIIDREAQLENQIAQLEKIMVDIQNRKSDLQSSLRSEEAAFNLKKLEMEQFKFESERIRKIKELEFKQAQIRLEKVKKNAEFYEIISKSQLKIQQIRVQNIREQINEGYSVLPQLTVRTPISGIFQVADKQRTRNKVMIGDDVYMGNPLGNVPDLTWMKVKTVVNEADFMKVYKGQPVKVRLDAMPSLVFDGEVSFISKLCRRVDRDSRLKVFDVEVKILVSDERLKPGMTVSCEYICSDLEDVFYVPISCVEKIDDEYFIYLVKGTGYEKRKVKAGPANNSSMVIEADVKRGQKLVPVSRVYEQKTN